MNGFRKMQKRLLEEGWYVGWNLPCCQSCAWSCLPDYLDAKYNDKGYIVHPETGEELDYKTRDEVYREVDLSKVLFNHSQDCEVDMYQDGMECETCDGEGYVYEEDLNEDQGEEDDDTCPDCDGSGFNTTLLMEDYDEKDFDKSVEGFLCLTPEAQCSSLFCFAGDKEGVENLKSIIPIIEECGVKVWWNETGDSRIQLSWEA